MRIEKSSVRYVCAVPYYVLCGFLLLVLRPLLQQLINGILDLAGRVILGEVFAAGLPFERDIVPTGLFLLAHDLEHTVLGQLTILESRLENG